LAGPFGMLAGEFLALGCELGDQVGRPREVIGRA
jgi:hypothetical protein